MDDDHNREDELEKHSLPGTNQAGKGPKSNEKDCDENQPAVQGSPQQDGPGKHNPSDTNQTAE